MSAISIGEFSVSADGKLDAAWLSDKLGKLVEEATLRDFQTIGGMFGEFHMVDANLQDGGVINLVLKTIPENKLATSIALGTAREALFYSELAGKLGSAMPKMWYAHGTMETGAKVILMECLEDAVPVGVFFGPSNPNNWDFRDKLEAFSLGNPTPEQVSADAFCLYAQLHASFWLDESVLDLPWLRGVEWKQNRGEASWQGAQKMAADAWKARDAAAVKWDEHLVACLDVSFGDVSWERYQLDIGSRSWTVVQGDCHPGNAMWVNQRTESARICLIDFEMVGIGSGPQELGQWVVSHMTPATRRSCERSLVQGYHQELTKALRSRGLAAEADAFSFEVCWAEYVAGGACRWAWMATYLTSVLPQDKAQFFLDQLSEFLRDHVPDPASMGMPRV